MRAIEIILVKQEIHHFESVDRDNWRWDPTSNKLETIDASHWLKGNEGLFVNTETGKVQRKYK